MKFNTQAEAIQFIRTLAVGTHTMTIAPGYGKLFYEAAMSLGSRYLELKSGTAPGLVHLTILGNEATPRPSRADERTAIDNMDGYISFELEPKRLAWIRAYVYTKYKSGMSVRVADGKIVVERKTERRKSVRDRVMEAIGNGLPAIIPCAAREEQNIRNAIASMRSRGRMRAHRVDGGMLVYDLQMIIDQAFLSRQIR